jgi:hypothetical protein
MLFERSSQHAGDVGSVTHRRCLFMFSGKVLIAA